MKSPYVMRPAELSDFDALRSMAVESGPGFTSLPVDEDILRKRLLKSVDSFAGRLEQPELGKYLMMLENTETGEDKFLPIIGDDHIAAMPYEIILQGNTASILPGRYRIALHWPDLTMGTFMKIMSTPKDIAETLSGLTK